MVQSFIIGVPKLLYLVSQQWPCLVLTMIEMKGSSSREKSVFFICGNLFDWANLIRKNTECPEILLAFKKVVDR